MQENQDIEFKEIWRDDYIKWICGFANAKGGKIYIGIDDVGKVVGIDNAQKLLEDIPNKVRDILGIIIDLKMLGDIQIPPFSSSPFLILKNLICVIFFILHLLQNKEIMN